MMPARICFNSVDVEREGIDNLNKILDIFKKYNISGTLFVTGEFLEKYGDFAKNWPKDCEVACHGFTHKFWNTLNSEERGIEIDRFNNLYQNIFQKKPLGFRAPSHIINKEGLRLLAEKGFLYDSSIVPHYPPFKKYRGYKGKRPLLPYHPEGLNILEIPVRGQIWGIPLAGAWINKLPFWFYQILFFIHCPEFITLSIHSWDKLKNFEKIVKLLKDKNYQFSNGAEIFYKNYR